MNYKYTMTVIVPSFNNGEYIAETIESILSQNVDFSLQIIISDDGSTDNSVSIIKKYANKYPDIILALYSDKNLGLFNNYYRAVGQMDSKYFCVLDSDDYYIDSRRLQKAYDFLEANEDFTIYAMNSVAYDVITGKETIKYYPDMPIGERHISTFDDYINGRAILCNTPGTTFRNIVYSDEIIYKIKELCKNKINQAAFRADSGRNLIHLTMGKAMFVNDIVARYRVHDHNIAQRKKDFENFIQLANSYIIYNYFFEDKYISKIYEIVFKYYRQAIVSYSWELFSAENIMDCDNESALSIIEVHKWLDKNKNWSHNVAGNYYNIRLLHDVDKKKIAIWGTGISLKKLIKKYKIKMKPKDIYIDGTYNKGQIGELSGNKIYAADDVKIENDRILIICSSYYKDIIEYIKEKNICQMNQVINLFAYDLYYGMIN